MSSPIRWLLSALLISFTLGTETGESINQQPLTADKPVPTGCGHDGKSVGDGDTIDVGSFWYSCVSGHLVTSGCRSEEGRRVRLGETFDVSGYEVVCSGAPGKMRLTISACLHEGKRLVAGDSFEDKFFWYSCALGNGSLVKKVAGCMDESGKRVSLGNTVKTANYIFQCQQGSNASVEFTPIACVKDGVQYKVGQPFTVGQFWYSCAQQNGFVTTKLSGCATDDGKRLAHGEKYRKNGFVVECQISPGNSVAHAIVGCVPTEHYGSPATAVTQVFQVSNNHSDTSNGTRVRREAVEERKLGETWLAGTPPFLFLVKCEKLATGAKQNLIKCHYQGPEGSFQLDPGCYRMTDAFVLTCYQRPDGGLSMNSVAILKGRNATTLQSEGLKNCGG